MLLAAAVVLVALLAAWGSRRVFRGQTELGVGVSEVAWLPKTASQICFVRKGGSRKLWVAEFRMERSEFEAWARDEGWTVKPLDRVLLIPRFTLYLPQGHAERAIPFYVSPTRGLIAEPRGGVARGATIVFDERLSMVFWARDAG